MVKTEHQTLEVGDQLSHSELSLIKWEKHNTLFSFREYGCNEHMNVLNKPYTAAPIRFLLLSHCIDISDLPSRLKASWWQRPLIFHTINVSSVQSLSRVQLFATPWITACQPPCPSPTPWVHSDSHQSSQWCHPAISSSVIPFSSCPQSLLAL